MDKLKRVFSIQIAVLVWKYVKKPVKSLLIISLTLSLFAACQNISSQNAPTQRIHPPSANCRSIEHDAGETPICGQPQKIVAVSPYILDMMLSLGAQPAAHAEVWLHNSKRFDNPSQQIPYLGSRVTTQPINLGSRHSPSLEALVALKPDLILTEYRNQYELLSKIAPTVYVEYNKGGWKRNIHTIAKALDRETQVQQVLATHEQQMSETRRELAPVLRTHPRLLLLSASNLGAPVDLFYKDPPATVLDDLGFQLVRPKDMEEGTRRSISIETLSQLEADLAIVSVWKNNSYDIPLENFKQEWNQIPLLQNMQVNKKGCVYFVDGVLWSGFIRGPIADEIVMQQLPELLLPPCS